MIELGWSRREKVLAGAVVGVIILFIASFFWEKKQTDPLENALKNVKQQERKSTALPNEDPKMGELWVDVKGAVHKPGIYKLKPDTRVFQAIEEAGGIVGNADTNRMNLAQPVSDGMVIYIPKKGEAPNSFMSQENLTHANSSSRSSEKVNINSATEQELQTLPGIGPSKAEAIVQYRNEHGNYTSVEDLRKISGLGEKTIARFKDQITVP